MKLSFLTNSPEGRRFRSRPEVKAYLDTTGSSYTLDDFEFNVKKLSSFTASPAHVKAPKEKKLKEKKPKKTPVKKTPKAPAVKKPKSPKVKAKGDTATKRKRVKEAKSPGRKEKKTRNVLKPPSSRSQKLQKLLVKINFGKKQASSEEDSSEDESDSASDSASDDGASPPKKARKIATGV